MPTEHPPDDVMVVRERRRRKEQGAYLITHRSEWESDAWKVHAWRGPDKPEEDFLREDLIEVSCRTLQVDLDGFWKCPAARETLESAYTVLEPAALEELAQQQAAYIESDRTATELADRYGNAYVVARFGPWVGINGHVARRPARPRVHPRPPRFFEDSETSGDTSLHAGVFEEDLARALRDEISRRLGYAVHTNEVLRIVRKRNGTTEEDPLISVLVAGKVKAFIPPADERDAWRRQRQRLERPSRRKQSWTPRRNLP